MARPVIQRTRTAVIPNLRLAAHIKADCNALVSAIDINADGQAGKLPQWSEAPRFEKGFWTEAPLVNRSNLKTGAKRVIRPGAANSSNVDLKNNTDGAQPSRPQPGLLPQWSEVPRFHEEFWTEAPLVDREKMIKEKDGMVGGRKIPEHRQDHLINGSQIDFANVPATPPKKLSQNPGIRQARKSNADHLMQIATVDPDLAPPDDVRHFDQNSGIIRGRKSNRDHLSGVASVSQDYSIVPATPEVHLAQNPDIIQVRKAHRDHLIGVGSQVSGDRELVPEERERHRSEPAKTHLLGAAAQVDPESEPPDPVKRLQQRPNSFCPGGGLILLEEAKAAEKGSGAKLLDWWGNPTTGTACASATPRRGRVESICSDACSGRTALSVTSVRTARSGASDRAGMVNSMVPTERISTTATKASMQPKRNVLDFKRSPRKEVHRIFGACGAPATIPIGGPAAHSTIPAPNAFTSRSASVDATPRSSRVPTAINEFLVKDRQWTAPASAR